MGKVEDVVPLWKDVTDVKDISDGYHTFGELYEHRHLLFLCMAKLARYCDRIDIELWYTRQHHPDNEPMFNLEGEKGVLVGVELPTGSIQYHMPVRFIPALQKMWVKELAHGPFYDGTDSPEAALERMMDFLVK